MTKRLKSEVQRINQNKKIGDRTQLVLRGPAIETNYEKPKTQRNLCSLLRLQGLQHQDSRSKNKAHSKERTDGHCLDTQKTVHLITTRRRIREQFHPRIFGAAKT